MRCLLAVAGNVQSDRRRRDDLTAPGVMGGRDFERALAKPCRCLRVGRDQRLSGLQQSDDRDRVTLFCARCELKCNLDR